MTITMTVVIAGKTWQAYPDGSFDMRPGFSKPGKKYRFEDDRGVRVVPVAPCQAIELLQALD
jgi:hypothetical protein